MKKADQYSEMKKGMKQKSTKALVERFNAQVGKRCWASVRAAHDTALIDTLVERGVDVSAVYNGESISFKEHVVLNEDLNKLYILK